MDTRTAIHSALADEHRLSIADALALGDHTPGALAEKLSLSSNLLAHHLGVLAAAGVINRHRSEGDGRRSYVSLDWHHPVVAASVRPPARLAAPRVVFVCTHNSARSQFAASLLAQASQVPVASAGTEPSAAIHPYALAALEARGLSPPRPTPQHWDTVVTDTDVVIAVCDNAYESLHGNRTPDLHWSIPDPARRGRRDDFHAALAAVHPRVTRLAHALTAGDPHE